MNERKNEADHALALERARALRVRQTEVEQTLWYHLRAHRFMGLKFKRQQPIGRYIVDFVCFELKLIIELDGGQHQDNAQYDLERDAWLKTQGNTIFRFWNQEICQELASVLEAIRVTVNALCSATVGELNQ